MDNDYLEHHGILGQRWGIRRYQNKDGTLTTAGKKRYDKEMSKLKAEEKVLNNRKRTQEKIDKLKNKRVELDNLKNELDGKNNKSKNEKEKANKLVTKKPIKLKNVSDEDLIRTTNRLKLEKDYLETRKRILELTPQKVSLGKKIIDKVWNKTISPALLESGKDILKKATTQLGDSLLSELGGQAQTNNSGKKTQTNTNNTQKSTSNAQTSTSKSSTKSSTSSSSSKQTIFGTGTSWTNNPFSKSSGPTIDADFVIVDDSSSYNAGKQYVSNFLQSNETKLLQAPKN